MRKSHLLLPACLCLCFALLAQARPCAADSADPVAPQPRKVLVTHNGASVLAQAAVPVQKDGQTAFFTLLLPEDAADVTLHAEGHEISRISEGTAMLPAETPASDMRTRLLRDKCVLSGRIEALKAQAKEIGKDQAKTARVEELYASIADAEARIAHIEAALKRFPAQRATGRLVTAVLAGAVNASTVKVACGYTLSSCGWSPSYAMDCVPGKDGMGEISVRLEANVVQRSGMDWTDAELTLVSADTGATGLPSLRSWIIGDDHANFAARGRVMEDAAPMAMEEASPRMRKAAAPQARAQTSGSYASWTPFARGLKQGSNRVLIASDTWKERLVWLARPLNRDARVFLTAEHEFDGKAYWPAGPARLSVEGVAVGETGFEPAKGKVLLSFGPDPRVALSASTQPRKSGTEGFIGTKKVWEWAWTYTVRNDRETPVRVRIERPLPQSADKDVLVEHSEEPAARTEDKTLVWELDCAPRKTVAVSHGVKVTAPEKMHLSPSAP